MGWENNKSSAVSSGLAEELTCGQMAPKENLAEWVSKWSYVQNFKVQRVKKVDWEKKAESFVFAINSGCQSWQHDNNVLTQIHFNATNFC